MSDERCTVDLEVISYLFLAEVLRMVANERVIDRDSIFV